MGSWFGKIVKLDEEAERRFYLGKCCIEEYLLETITPYYLRYDYIYSARLESLIFLKYAYLEDSDISQLSRSHADFYEIVLDSLLLRPCQRIPENRNKIIN